jgi:hypothetical protein
MYFVTQYVSVWWLRKRPVEINGKFRISVAAYCFVCVLTSWAVIAPSVWWLDYGLDDRGSIPGGGWEYFSSPPRPERPWSPPSLLSSEYQGLFPGGVKRLKREADHSPPSSAGVKGWMELYLHSLNASSWRSAQLKHRDIFSFTFMGVNVIFDTEGSLYVIWGESAEEKIWL